MSSRLITTVAALVVSLFAATASAGGDRTPRRPAVVRVTDPSFRWGDAAVGAAAALGLVLVTGGLLVARHGPRRYRR